MSKLHLYGHENSGHAYKVALALRLGQIAYSYERVDIYQPCQERPIAFQKASRWCEVPCLLWNDEPMIQSAAILLRIAREFNVLGGVAGLDQAAEWLNWEANRIGMCIPQLIQAKTLPGAVNEGAQAWLKARYEIVMGRLNAALLQSPFLLGEAVSIADLSVYGYVSKLEKAELAAPIAVLDWRKRIENLTFFQNAETLLA